MSLDPNTLLQLPIIHRSDVYKIVINLLFDHNQHEIFLQHETVNICCPQFVEGSKALFRQVSSRTLYYDGSGSYSAILISYKCTNERCALNALFVLTTCITHGNHPSKFDVSQMITVEAVISLVELSRYVIYWVVIRQVSTGFKSYLVSWNKRKSYFAL